MFFYLKQAGDERNGMDFSFSAFSTHNIVHYLDITIIYILIDQMWLILVIAVVQTLLFP